MKALLYDPTSGVTELEDGVDYAGIYVRHATRQPWGDALRPVKVRLLAEHEVEGEKPLVTIEDPSVPGQAADLDVDWLSLLIVGRWEDKIHSWWDWDIRAVDLHLTWQGYAAQQSGEVLRQRELAERLTAFGIERKPTSYVPHDNESNAVQRSLTLNYDELDALLRAAGY